MEPRSTFWTAVAITAIWVAVALIGLFGGDIVTNNAGGQTSVPVVTAVVPFALVATIVVARRGFGRGEPRAR